MALTRRRSPSSVLVQKGSIEQAGSLLQQLPEKPRDSWSLREAIELLQDDITLALNRGYSHEEVAKMLSEKGVKISPSSLKSYLAATRKDKDSGAKGRRGGGRKKRTSEPTAVEAASVEPDEQPASARKRGPRSTTAARTKTAAKAKAQPVAKTTRAAKAAAPAAKTGRGGRRKKDA